MQLLFLVGVAILGFALWQMFKSGCPPTGGYDEGGPSDGHWPGYQATQNPTRLQTS
jgi:hypothetical protein